jgi:hypothetical protein
MTMQYTFENETGRRTDAALCDDCAEYHEEYPAWGSMVYAEAPGVFILETDGETGRRIPITLKCDGVELAHGRACINAYPIH